MEREKRGEVSVMLADGLGDLLRIQGKERLERANEYLKDHSLVVVSNHPNTLGTVYGVEAVFQNLTNRKEMAIVMTSKFAEGRMGIYGALTLSALKNWGIEYLRVHQYYDKRVSEEQRFEASLRAMRRCKEILSKPGGVV